MGPIQLEPGPDGTGWWPTAFGVDTDWSDGRGTAWRAVTNYPALQARRVDETLELRQAGATDTHTYHLVAADDLGGYIATKD